MVKGNVLCEFILHFASTTGVSLNIWAIKEQLGLPSLVSPGHVCPHFQWISVQRQCPLVESPIETIRSILCLPCVSFCPVCTVYLRVQESYPVSYELHTKPCLCMITIHTEPCRQPGSVVAAQPSRPGERISVTTKVWLLSNAIPRSRGGRMAQSGFVFPALAAVFTVRFQPSDVQKETALLQLLLGSCRGRS